jgi:transposase
MEAMSSTILARTHSPKTQYELAIYLHEAGHMVSIVNPARIKGFAQRELLRTKTDKLDAALIARFCLVMKPGPWRPPSPEIRSLRALVRRVDSLIDMRSQEKNRISTAHESSRLGYPLEYWARSRGNGQLSRRRRRRAPES